MKSKVQKVAIYIRVSKKDNSQDTENQLLQLQEFCKTNNYTIHKIYKDNESGKKGREERKGFDELFKDARAKKFNLVLFWALDRFSREGMFKTIKYLERLDSYGINFRSYTEDYLHTDNELTRNLLLAMMSTFAKLEIQKISDRTKAGLERAKKQGKILGRVPVDKETILQIQELRKSGLSISKTAKKLKVSISTVRKYQYK